MITLLLMLSIGQPPQAPTASKGADYASVLARVESGESLTVYAGVPLPSKPEPNAVRIDSIPGESAGVYSCWREGKTPRMKRREPERRAAVVTVAGHSHRCPVDGTVWSHADKGLTFDDHFCPTCGREERIQFEENIRVPVAVKETPKIIPLTLNQYQNCPNGNCPGTVPVRRGLFR